MDEITEGCIGRFGDAFDCPVHDPRKQPGYVEPILAAERRGAAQVLRTLGPFIDGELIAVAALVGNGKASEHARTLALGMQSAYRAVNERLRALALVTPESGAP